MVHRSSDWSDEQKIQCNYSTACLLIFVSDCTKFPQTPAWCIYMCFLCCFTHTLYMYSLFTYTYTLMHSHAWTNPHSDPHRYPRNTGGQVESILCAAPGDDYGGAAWLHDSQSAGSAALIPDTKANVNPSKDIFSSQKAFVSYLNNGSFKLCRWRKWDQWEQMRLFTLNV